MTALWFLPRLMYFLRISKMLKMGNAVRILPGHICARANIQQCRISALTTLVTEAEILFNVTISYSDILKN